MSENAIFTIGYGKRDADQVIALLQRHNIAYLIDVRSRPYSRFKPEFSRRELTQRVQAAGLRYVYMGDTLGGQPDDPSCYSDGKVVYDTVRSREFYQKGLGRLQEAWRQGLRVALLCSEGKPEMCHRSKLIGRSLTDLAIPVQHIDEGDELIEQQKVMLRLTDGQYSWLDNDGLTSRKRYRAEEDEEDD